MLFTVPDSQSSTSATTCYICTNLLREDKVRGHCHITGNYRGAAHNECNLNYGIKPKSWKLPVVIHNLKGYDGHLRALKSGIWESDGVTAEYGEISFFDCWSITISRFGPVHTTRV